MVGNVRAGLFEWIFYSVIGAHFVRVPEGEHCTGLRVTLCRRLRRLAGRWASQPGRYRLFSKTCLCGGEILPPQAKSIFQERSASPRARPAGGKEKRVISLLTQPLAALPR